MKRKPLIGITMRLEMSTRRFYLGCDYSEALAYFGAVPVHLGLIANRSYLHDAVGRLDGILLPGSDTDVDPLRFGQEPHPNLGTVIWEKEETDLLVLAEAEKRNLPVLGICFGMQILNVFRGGTLIQDIKSQIENPLKHQQGEPLARNSHSVSIKKGSKLYKFAKSETALVNSHHHQSIENPGRDLAATAIAKDGIIECIEDQNQDRFVMGVQWHPELSYRTDPLNKSIFETFVKKCSKNIKR